VHTQGSLSGRGEIVSLQYRDGGSAIEPRSTIESRPDMSRFMSGTMSKIDAVRTLDVLEAG
jgi:hypothetical protein